MNWYHFADETLRFGGSCLLLGDNGSGKSTVLDAVQWALVADQQQARFNKAANEQSRRGLYSYVRYKLGSEDETRPGQVRFGRGACASYVILQFADDRDPAGDFACGIAMEATEADTHVARAHFVRAAGHGGRRAGGGARRPGASPPRLPRRAPRHPAGPSLCRRLGPTGTSCATSSAPLPQSIHRLII